MHLAVHLSLAFFDVLPRKAVHCMQNFPLSQISGRHAVDKTKTENVTEEGFAILCTYDSLPRTSYHLCAQVKDWRGGCILRNTRVVVVDGNPGKGWVAEVEVRAPQEEEGIPGKIAGHASDSSWCCWTRVHIQSNITPCCRKMPKAEELIANHSAYPMNSAASNQASVTLLTATP